MRRELICLGWLMVTATALGAQRPAPRRAPAVKAVVKSAYTIHDVKLFPFNGEVADEAGNATPVLLLDASGFRLRRSMFEGTIPQGGPVLVIVELDVLDPSAYYDQSQVTISVLDRGGYRRPPKTIQRQAVRVTQGAIDGYPPRRTIIPATFMLSANCSGYRIRVALSATPSGLPVDQKEVAYPLFEVCD